MDKVYICGHKKPDTDSVTSAINLAYLKNKLGYTAEARVLGEINKETRFVLSYFKVDEPGYLNNVRLQIRDVDYHRGYCLPEDASILEVYEYMIDHHITGVPLVDKEGILVGLITEKMLTKALVEGSTRHFKTSYQHLLYALDGEEILRFDERIEGTLVVDSFFQNEELNDPILLLENTASFMTYINMIGAKTVIVVDNGFIDEEMTSFAKVHQINLIRTSKPLLKAVKKVSLAQSIEALDEIKNPTSFQETDSFFDFLEESKRLKHNNYPVVDKQNHCLGLIRVTDITKKNKKKVILVDHNEKEQSVNGLEEAEILEIVDHHKIGDLTTSLPINFRNMAVGSTNTIIYHLYRENHIEIPYTNAGLMMSGILSDTLNLTSPTTTSLDIEAIQELNKIVKLDVDDYALTMLKKGISLEGKTKEDILTLDLKVFPIKDFKVAVSQVLTFNSEEICSLKEEYLEAMHALVLKNDYQEFIFIVTDLLQKGSYFFYTPSMEKVLMDAFHLETIEEGFYLPDILSRKKQVVPVLVDIIEGK